jgi:hypothetical protein
MPRQSCPTEPVAASPPPPATLPTRGSMPPGRHKAAAVNLAQKIESHADLAAVADASFSAEEESSGVQKVLGAARDQAVKMAEFHASFHRTCPFVKSPRQAAEQGSE